MCRSTRPMQVSIHATLVGGDIPTSRRNSLHRLFLSTPPSWVATIAGHLDGSENCWFLSTPPSWVATLGLVCKDLVQIRFLSTPPSWVATKGETRRSRTSAFLSTPPSWVATAKVYKNVQCLLRKKEKIICKIKNNLKHPPHIPIATSKKCTACPKTSDGIGAKLLGKVCLLPPRTGAATQTAHHPEQIRGGGQGAPRGFCSGCQAGKSAGCRFRGQSARPARL